MIFTLVFNSGLISIVSRNCWIFHLLPLIVGYSCCNLDFLMPISIVTLIFLLISTVNLNCCNLLLLSWILEYPYCSPELLHSPIITLNSWVPLLFTWIVAFSYYYPEFMSTSTVHLNSFQSHIIIMNCFMLPISRREVGRWCSEGCRVRRGSSAARSWARTGRKRRKRKRGKRRRKRKKWRQRQASEVSQEFITQSIEI